MIANRIKKSHQMILLQLWMITWEDKAMSTANGIVNRNHPPIWAAVIALADCLKTTLLNPMCFHSINNLKKSSGLKMKKRY